MERSIPRGPSGTSKIASTFKSGLVNWEWWIIPSLAFTAIASWVLASGMLNSAFLRHQEDKETLTVVKQHVEDVKERTDLIKKELGDAKVEIKRLEKKVARKD
jgi:hypothetical protein